MILYYFLENYCLDPILFLASNMSRYATQEASFELNYKMDCCLVVEV